MVEQFDILVISLLENVNENLYYPDERCCLIVDKSCRPSIVQLEENMEMLCIDIPYFQGNYLALSQVQHEQNMPTL